MQNITWTYCQENSDKILSDGLLKLIDNDVVSLDEVLHSDQGNYLISYKDMHYYIGEGKNIRARLKQQFKPNTSTFYKNYQRSFTANEKLQSISIDNFSIRFISTAIGRKEIEDFGIVNLATPLNKFQKDKRLKVDFKSQNGLWEKIQEQKDELLKQAEESVFKEQYVTWFDCSPKAIAGLYVVKNDARIIYIGESSDIFERHTTHSTRTYFSALRRSVATDILSYELKEKNGKKKYLTDIEDKRVTEYIMNTSALFIPVSFGRYELEEYLIKKHQPLLNRKGNSRD